MSKVLIVVPDVTRKAHLKTVLPKALGVLRKGRIIRKKKDKKGIIRESQEVKIIVATGLHRPHTKEELKNLVGERIFSGYQVITHTQDKRALTYKGRTKDGIPISLNKNLSWADTIVSVGLIEPHLYAGYSGGAKTIAIGLAGEETINATHHPRFLAKARTAIGALKNNPFQDCLWEIIRGLPIEYSINVINDRNGKLKKIFIGELKRGIREFKKKFYREVNAARKIFEKKLNKTYDAVICRVSPPKDVNMYQASRAFNYILDVKRPILKRGGILLVCASLRDGFGKGLGERRFAKAMKKVTVTFSDCHFFKGCLAGEHRAYMVARAMRKARLGFIGLRAALYTKGLPFLSFPNVRSAIKFIRRKKGKRAAIYTVHSALSNIITR